LAAVLIGVPLHASGLQPGQVVSSGDRGCQLDALPLPGGFAVYDHAGNLLDQQAPSPGGSTLRHLIGVGNGVAGVPDGGANETAIATVDADGNRIPFAPQLTGLSSASILGLAPASRNAVYAVVGSEVWRIERSAGVTLKRQLPAHTGASLALDTDASGCTLYYAVDGGRIARFNVCTGSASTDFGGGASFAAAEIRVLPDGGIVVHDRSKLQRYDRDGTLIRELPLDNCFPHALPNSSLRSRRSLSMPIHISRGYSHSMEIPAAARCRYSSISTAAAPRTRRSQISRSIGTYLWPWRVAGLRPVLRPRPRGVAQ
jgi:hypothetical protein